LYSTWSESNPTRPESNPTKQVKVNSHVVYNEPTYAFGEADNHSMSRSQEKYLESLFESFDGPNISPYE
jgi:hypothetical protein